MTAKVDTALQKFASDSQMTLAWLGATEALWMSAPPTTEVRRNLRTPQMEALYESAYLRIFASWEVFQEELTIRMMAGAKTATYTPVPAPGKMLYPTLKAARAGLYGQSDFLLWHNPDKAHKRISRVLSGSPLESEIIGNKATLHNYAHIRHRVAHGSSDAATKFTVAAQNITGVAYNGTPGKLLRALDATDALNPRRWISVISTSLLETAKTCVN